MQPNSALTFQLITVCFFLFCKTHNKRNQKALPNKTKIKTHHESLDSVKVKVQFAVVIISNKSK